MYNVDVFTKLCADSANFEMNVFVVNTLSLMVLDRETEFENIK